MFAVLVIEREPLQAKQLIPALVKWVQDAGMFAQFGLIIGLLIWLMGGFGTRKWSSLGKGILIVELVVLLAYAVYLASKASDIWLDLNSFFEGKELSARPAAEWVKKLRALCLFVGGAGSIIAVLLPILADAARLRLRRIWALTRFTILEVVRMRVLWVFPMLFLIFLFPPSWFFALKSEEMISVDVKTAYWMVMFLLWFPFVLLASFGLPTDMYRQTIHTIVTKPVERFEIILGRFLGYTLLMTTVLVVMTVCSLVYMMARGVTPEAAQESFKARVTKYGDRLKFYQAGQVEDKGINVGKIWEYRSYIPGPSTYFPRQHALWTFDEIPVELTQRDWVPCEFAFDVQRTTIGSENRGVLCSFYFITPACPLGASGLPLKETEYDDARTKAKTPDTAALDAKLAREFGFYKVLEFEIKERRTQSIMVPGTLFSTQTTPAPAKRAAGGSAAGEATSPPPLQVRVQCESPTQFVGMARRDLYFRTDSDDPMAEQWWFAVNFGKGMFGVWCRASLVIGLAVAMSTYLSSAVTFLLVTSVYVGGLFRAFLFTVMNRQGGGGPAESALRLFAHKYAGDLNEVDTTNMAYRSDKVFQWIMRIMFSIFPDMERFNLKEWVAAGFNIPWTMLLVDDLLPMIGYLAPWLVLGYYLLKWREIASS